MVVYPIIYKVFYSTSQVVSRISSINSMGEYSTMFFLRQVIKALYTVYIPSRERLTYPE